MLDALKNFFFTNMARDSGEGPGDAPRTTDREIRLAACALLLELAHADDAFSPEEAHHMEAAIRRHWGLDRAQAEELLALAQKERARATDLWQFTNLIRSHYSTGQKMVLAEIMWGVVYSDGELSSREEYLMRKISHLLGLEIGFLSQARERVRERDADVPGVD